MSNTPYTPEPGHFIFVTNRATPFAEPMLMRVLAVIPMAMIPDAAEMHRLFARRIERNRGSRAGLGIPTKMSSHPRVVGESRGGRVWAFPMDSGHRIERVVGRAGQDRPDWSAPGLSLQESWPHKDTAKTH